MLSMRPAQRREFFSEVLGLTQLQQYAETAKQTAAVFARRGQAICNSIAECERVLSQRPKVESALVSVATQLAALREDGERARSLLVELATRCDAARQQVLFSNQAKEEVGRLQQQRLEVGQGTLNALGRELTEVREQIITAQARLYEQREKVELMLNGRTPEQVSERLQELREHLEKLQRDEEACQLDQKLAREESELTASFRLEETRLQAEIAHREEAISGLAGRPDDAPDDLCRRCQFTQVAYHAQEQLPRWRERLEHAHQQHEQAAELMRRDREARVGTVRDYDLV